jgi:hypothetical protein
MNEYEYDASYKITSGTCLCSKESARLDLYPLSPRLPSRRREGRESQGERLWVLCTEPDLQPSEWRNHWARADSPRQEEHLWQSMQINRLECCAMAQAVSCDFSPRRLGFDPRAIYGGQSGTGTGVLNRELRFSHANYFSANAPYSFIHSFLGMEKRQSEAAVATNSHPIKILAKISQIFPFTWSCGR